MRKPAYDPEFPQYRPTREPLGATVDAVGTHFRVWAPAAQNLAVALHSDGKGKHYEEPHLLPLRATADGYFTGSFPAIAAGARYHYQIDGQALFPDPASAYQPEGPHGPSQVVDHQTFRWSDQNWRGPDITRQVLYEMHIGTFTPEGTWQAAQAQLPALRDLGITTIEMMPVADFPGSFGWGYDGVDLFAPCRLYGTPDDLRAFVDTAHRLELAVILDVVYNHLGPDGNFLARYAADYVAQRYHSEWGDTFNFDDTNSVPVRAFVLQNVAHWISHYHFDGLRLDATTNIFDRSQPHLLQEIAATAAEAAGERQIFIVAENETQRTQLIRSPAQQGYGLDAVVNDDFHHSAYVALTGHHEAYYTDYRGTAQEFVALAKYGYLYQGQYYLWQKQPRGTYALDIAPWRFVNFLDNHDQVANSAQGLRLRQLAQPGAYRALTTALLLLPQTPMLFQGQEYGAAQPFLFFADHRPEIAAATQRGRLEFLQQFPSLNDATIQAGLDLPHVRATFLRCLLDPGEREQQGPLYALHRDLLKLRRDDPLFTRGALDGAVLNPEAFVLRYFGDDHDDRLLLVNLGRDLPLHPCPEPLLAPPPGKRWTLLFSSEAPGYGGSGSPPLMMQPWQLPGHAALVLTAAGRDETQQKTEAEGA